MNATVVDEVTCLLLLESCGCSIVPIGSKAVQCICSLEKHLSPNIKRGLLLLLLKHGPEYYNLVSIGLKSISVRLHCRLTII